MSASFIVSYKLFKHFYPNDNIMLSCKTENHDPLKFSIGDFNEKVTLTLIRLDSTSRAANLTYIFSQTLFAIHWTTPLT